MASPLCGFTPVAPALRASPLCSDHVTAFPCRTSRVVLCSAGSQDSLVDTPPSSCRSLRAVHLLHPAPSLHMLESPRPPMPRLHFSRPLNTWQLILLGAFLRVQLAMITEHPQGNVTGTSGAPLQLRFGCHIPGDLGRGIYSVCRKDQELLSPDTAIRMHPSQKSSAKEVCRPAEPSLSQQSGTARGAPDSTG